MTILKQKDAVKLILDFLPQEAILYHNTELKNIMDVWYMTNDLYCHNTDDIHFHFSSVRCTHPTFTKTMCLCFTVAFDGYVTYFDRHLPYKGTGPGCKKI